MGESRQRWHGRRAVRLGLVLLLFAVGRTLSGCDDGDSHDGGDEFDGFHAADLTYLAGDALDGRDNTTAGSEAAQAYLIDQIRGFAVGVDSNASGDESFKQHFTQGTNILGMIRGSELPDEYVIVGAHYDHFAGCAGVCNGATDNAAGTVAVLAIAREIGDNPVPPRRSVIFAFWDREEDGLLGSQYYIQHPLVPRAQTVAYVNYDIQGTNLLPSLRRITFAIASETGGDRLAALVAEASADIDLDTRSLSSIFGQGRSDYFHFVNAHIPTVFFSDSTGPCYHTSGDDPSIVDLGKLAKQSEMGTRLVESLANTTELPSYRQTAITFQDAEVIREVVATALVDIDRFGAEDRAFVLEFSAQLDAVVADGAANFDGPDINVLAGGVLRVIDVLTQQPCDGFLE